MTASILTASADSQSVAMTSGNEILWGERTNVFCAGAIWCSSVDGGTNLQTLGIHLMTSKTNAGWGYLAPPDHKLARAELRDAGGRLIAPRAGKKLDAQLPNEILFKDLPLDPRIGHSGGAPSGRLSFPVNLPIRFGDFPIQETYRIEKAGE